MHYFSEEDLKGIKNAWYVLHASDMTPLDQARRQLHQAVQAVGIISRSLSPDDPGDKYGALHWDSATAMMTGTPVGNPTQFAPALCVADLTLHLMQNGESVEECRLDGRYWEEAMLWAEANLILEEAMGKTAFLRQDLPYTIPAYTQGPLNEDFVPFELADAHCFELMRNFYANAGSLFTLLGQRLEGVSETLIWPHHFDIAVLVQAPGKGPEATIGLGCAPGGDELSHEPYFYLKAYGLPEGTAQDHLAIAGGEWNTNNWGGWILKAETINATNPIEDECHTVARFVDQGVQALLGLY